MNTIILVLAVLGASAGIVYLLMKTDKVKDANHNNIPDTIEDKVEEVQEIVKEVKIRAKKVATEVKDVAKAVKEVAKQSKGVVSAAKGDGARRGRKPSQK